MARDPKFEEISPEVGEIDDQALADLVDEDPDHAMSLLAQMRGATDRQLAALAARLAGRLVLDVAKAGPVQAPSGSPARAGFSKGVGASNP